MIAMRFPVALRDKIIADIDESGDFRSLTEWMQCAAREYLKIRENEKILRGGGV